MPACERRADGICWANQHFRYNLFTGPCANARIEDLRAAARVVRVYRINAAVRAMVAPGSQAVKRAAEQEGLDTIFLDAGFEWREPGCSMCLRMNQTHSQRASVALRPATGTLKAGRDAAGALILSARKWLPPPSSDISVTFAHGAINKFKSSI